MEVQRVTFTFAMAKIATEFDAALDAFIMSRKVKNASLHTLNWYRKRLTTFIEFAEKLGRTPKNPFTPNNHHLHQPTPSINFTANGDLCAVKAFCFFLVAKGIRDDNPAEGIEHLKEPVYYLRTLLGDQIVANPSCYLPSQLF